MAHFAELDGDNIVLRVVVVDNSVVEVEDVLDGEVVIRDDEQAGIDWLNDLYPESGTWVQTSYSARIRFRYAAVGGSYDADTDRFYDQKPFPSWTLDESPPYGWIPPTPHPDDGRYYLWDEDSASWVETALPGA